MAIENLNLNGVIYDITEELKQDLAQNKSDIIMIEQGYWAIASGSPTNSSTWCRTNKFINKDAIVKTTTSNMWLLAFNKVSESYIGCWNGANFSTSYPSSLKIKEYNIAQFVANYPDYIFVIDFKRDSGNITPSDIYAELTVESAIKNSVHGIEDDIGLLHDIAIFPRSGKTATYYGVTIKTTDLTIELNGTSTSAVSFALNHKNKDSIMSYAGHTSAFQADRVCQSSIISGHYYKIHRELISGSVTRSGTTYTTDNFPSGTSSHLLNVMLFDETNTNQLINNGSIGEAINVSTTGIFETYIYSDTTYTNAVFEIWLEDITSKVTDLSTIPYYWDTEIETSISQINQNIADGDLASVTLAFITDCHWDANKKHSPAIMKKVLDDCNIRYFVNGGDIIEAYASTKALALQEITDIISAFRICRLPMITLYGNHDRNRYASDSSIYLSLEEHFNLVFKSFDSNAFTWLGDYRAFYWEDSNRRYVCTYWWSSADRVESWVAEACNTSKEIVLITHGLYYTVASDPTNDTIDSGWILTNFEPYKDKIRCIIQGHSHVDGLRYAWSTVPIIILDCDRFEDGAVEGTITEQSMSVLTISDDAIKVVKIGRGTDFTVTTNTPIFTGTQT